MAGDGKALIPRPGLESCCQSHYAIWISISQLPDSVEVGVMCLNPYDRNLPSLLLCIVPDGILPVGCLPCRHGGVIEGEFLGAGGYQQTKGCKWASWDACRKGAEGRDSLQSPDFLFHLKVAQPSAWRLAVGKSRIVSVAWRTEASLWFNFLILSLSTSGRLSALQGLCRLCVGKAGRYWKPRVPGAWGCKREQNQ